MIKIEHGPFTAGKSRLHHARHTRVTRSGRRLPKYDAYEVLLFKPCRRNQVESRFTGKARLQTLGSVKAPEEIVMGIDMPAVKVERQGGEAFVVVWKRIEKRSREDRHVARGSDLLRIRQTTGVSKRAVGHAQGLRFGVHHFDELFVTITNRFRDRR